MTKWASLKRVSTHSRPKAAGFQKAYTYTVLIVSTHSRPKAAGQSKLQQIAQKAVSTHSRPKAAGTLLQNGQDFQVVSTHSRPKAAGVCVPSRTADHSCFNTQPPEGGWSYPRRCNAWSLGFQHTAARRRLGKSAPTRRRSRACFNTQPPEGGWATTPDSGKQGGGFQHTAARRRLAFSNRSFSVSVLFQHTAARRRLGIEQGSCKGDRLVSTHSRPKAAGPATWRTSPKAKSFNTQPPEGGWSVEIKHSQTG